MLQWDGVGIPHKGWKCIGIFDLADETEAGEEVQYEQCEMCGNEKIRYIHVMKHPDFPREVYVGCVCAEKISGDYVNPRRLETALKNKAKRRQNFNRIKWKFNSEKNTYSKKYKGEYITIVESRYGSWGIFFAGQRIWDYKDGKIYSFEDAEKVAFEIFEEYHTTQEEREIKYYTK